jgi:hypothetical protein
MIHGGEMIGSKLAVAANGWEFGAVLKQLLLFGP